MLCFFLLRVQPRLSCCINALCVCVHDSTSSTCGLFRHTHAHRHTQTHTKHTFTHSHTCFCAQADFNVIYGSVCVSQCPKAFAKTTLPQTHSRAQTQPYTNTASHKHTAAHTHTEMLENFHFGLAPLALCSRSCISSLLSSPPHTPPCPHLSSDTAHPPKASWHGDADGMAVARR